MAAAEVMSASAGVRWYARTGPWLGIATGPGVYVLGGALAAALPAGALLVVLLLAPAVMVALTISHGYASWRRREPLVAATERVFGRGAGYRLLNLAMAFCLVGWFSFYVGIAGFSLATLLRLPGWLGAALLAALLLGLSGLGLRRWNALVWVTTLASLGAALVALLVVAPQLVGLPGGAVSAPPPPGPATYAWALGSVIAYSIVFGVRCGDFTWNLDRSRDLLWTGVVYYLTIVVALAVGVLIFRRTGESNLANVLARSPAAALGHVFLILSIISPALSNIFSGVRNIGALAPVPWRAGALGIAVTGALLGGQRFDLQLVSFLNLTGTLLPTVLLVLVYASLSPRRLAATAAVAAWLAGSGVALGLRLLGQETYVLTGLLVTGAVLALAYVRGEEK